ncbi:hypothetical protein EV363DRAFT_1165591, partial [Boletus edulis]
WVGDERSGSRGHGGGGKQASGENMVEVGYEQSHSNGHSWVGYERSGSVSCTSLCVGLWALKEGVWELCHHCHVITRGKVRWWWWCQGSIVVSIVIVEAGVWWWW